MENAKASTARRVIGTVKSLYTADELKMMEEGRDELRRKLAHGCTEPVAYNLPHIPRHVGKAAGERRFGLLKREYDSRRHAMTFQGGNRNESVQLHVNNQHWVLVSTPNRPGFALDKMAIPAKQRYFDELMQFAYSDYANRPRRSLQLWAKQRGTEPTIAAAVAYYYTPELMRKPTLEQLAYLLYFAQTKLYRQVTCRASGHLQCTIEGRTINLTSSAITHRHVGRKMAVVPVPGQSGEYMVYIADDIQNPTWVCQASDRTATTLDDAATMRAEVRYEREETARREWQEIAAVRQSQTTTTAQYMPLPNAPKFMGEIDGNAADEAQVESGEAHSEVIEVRSEDVLHVDARPITPTETGTVSEATLRALE
ncbi:MAG: hypothetical protein JNL32_07705 [Candidatus Kapabacteria bacterium]|nr:hypothetical protein [Candidatus Kapabacteria bacterium]